MINDNAPRHTLRTVNNCIKKSKKTISVGSLSNELGDGDGDGDGNENGRKAFLIGLDWQNNNCTRASRFFVSFFAVVARLLRKTSCFHVLWRTWTQDNNFHFLSLKYNPLEFNPRKNRYYLPNWTRWNKLDKVCSSVNILFEWRFCSRRRRCCFKSFLKCGAIHWQTDQCYSTVLIP